MIEGARLSEWPVWGFGLVMLLPLFVMVFSYGHQSPEIWRRSDEPEPMGRAAA